MSRDYPDFVIELLRARLMLQEADRARYDHSHYPLGVDECFGIRRQGTNDFFPASSLQGPFRALFQYHPKKALDLVLEFSNHAGEWYGERKWPGNNLEPAARITIEVPDKGPVEQWFLGRLYALYRGMTVGPYVLQSALMAMEAWLLGIANADGVDLEAWLLYILARSNSALTTSVVVSVCVANPTRAGRTAVALLSSRDLFEYDRARMAAEATHSIEFMAGLNPDHWVYEDEQRRANALPHRSEDLEVLALKLQLTDRRDEVWAIIDEHRAQLANQDPEKVSLWRLALHRMDIRGFRVVETPKASRGAMAIDSPARSEGGESTALPGAGLPPENAEERDVPGTPQVTEGVGEHGVYLGPGSLEPDLQALVAGSQKRLAAVNRHAALRLAAHKAWKDRRGPAATEWRSLLAEAQVIAEQDDEMDIFARGGPGIAAAVCIRDQLDTLSPKERAWCIARITHELSDSINDSDEISVHSRLFGPDRAAAAVVPLLVAKVPEQLPVDATDLLVRAFTHPAEEVVKYAYSGASAFLSAEHSDLGLRCAAAAAREAAVLEAARRKQNPLEPAHPVEIMPLVTAAVRDALTGSVEEAKAALASLRFDTWEGRAAASRVWQLMLARSDSAEGRQFVQRAAAWLARTWGEDRGSQRGQHRDFHAEHDLSRLIARFSLKLSDDAALDVCAPLIALTTPEPEELATFVEHLIYEADGGAGDSFWALWQAFADQAASAEWMARLTRERPHEGVLINRLFLRIPWKKGVTHWPRLDGNAHRVHELATRFPPAVVCMDAYLHFLYTIGRQGLPGAFKVVQSMLERAENPDVIFTSEVIFILESLLGQFVHGQPLRLKREAALREAVLKLLDHLVAAGSSAAYRMRDDFVTPLRESSA